MADENKSLEQIKRSVTINATPSQVWHYLTTPELMKKWMSDLAIEITTDWKIGSPIVIQGESYKTGFRNDGKVLQFEPGLLLEYTHLSSLSRLSDLPESYTTITFNLIHEADRTVLHLVINNFPTEVIYLHFKHYWSVTIELLRQLIETKSINPL